MSIAFLCMVDLDSGGSICNCHTLSQKLSPGAAISGFCFTQRNFNNRYRYKYSKLASTIHIVARHWGKMVCKVFWLWHTMIVMMLLIKERVVYSDVHKAELNTWNIFTSTKPLGYLLLTNRILSRLYYHYSIYTKISNPSVNSTVYSMRLMGPNTGRSWKKILSEEASGVSWAFVTLSTALDQAYLGFFTRSEPTGWAWKSRSISLDAIQPVSSWRP